MTPKQINAAVMYAQMQAMGRLWGRIALACLVAEGALVRLYLAEHPAVARGTRGTR